MSDTGDRTENGPITRDTKLATLLQSALRLRMHGAIRPLSLRLRGVVINLSQDKFKIYLRHSRS